MRKLVVPLLLSSVMLPSMAVARDGGVVGAIRSSAERSQRDSSSESRPQREERSRSESRGERPAGAERPDRVERQPRAERQVERREPGQQVQQVEQAAPVERVQRSERTGNAVLDAVRETARRGDRDSDGRDSDGRDWSNNRRDRDNDGRDWRNNDRDRDHRWSGDWRRDRRYDWSNYRSRYGSLYRLGRYYDPYGWGYRPFSVGFNLWPSYYGSGYWLNDPWMYRLPPAYGPYRWVRYYDDALLVNIYTGSVIDVVHNFFW
jgi:hypothetical protein